MKIQNMDFWNQLSLRPNSAILAPLRGPGPVAKGPPVRPLSSRSDASPVGEAGRFVLGIFLRTSLNYSKCYNWFRRKVGVFKKKKWKLFMTFYRFSYIRTR